MILDFTLQALEAALSHRLRRQLLLILPEKSRFRQVPAEAAISEHVTSDLELHTQRTAPKIFILSLLS